jgi:hypothetical protein
MSSFVPLFSRFQYLTLKDASRGKMAAWNFRVPVLVRGGKAAQGPRGRRLARVGVLGYN